MDASKPSKTADLVAAVRARHLKIYNPPIFVDPFAIKFCGKGWRRILGSKFLSWFVIDFMLRDILPLAPWIATRARYCEDIVDSMIEQGVEQYVIIGAGYDSFAMRRTDLENRLTVFELDQPGTQNEKFRRMAEYSIPTPKNVQYVDSDLNEVPLFTALTENGFDTSKPTAFSWFGVTYYLPLETIVQTLRSVADNSAKGSALFFDFRVVLDQVPDEWVVAHIKAAKFVARRGEPILTEFAPDELSELVLDCGFSSTDIPDTDTINLQYFSKMPASQKLTPTFRLCHAIC